MFRLKHFIRGLSLLLSLTLILAPVAPALAIAAKSGDVHAAHTFHDGEAAMLDHTVHHPSSCAPHDSSDDQCCGSCLQYSGTVSFTHSVYLPSHPVQIPVLSQLHPLVLVTLLDRPPRFRIL